MQERAYPVAELTEGIGVVDGTKRRGLGAMQPKTYVRASDCISRMPDGSIRIFRKTRKPSSPRLAKRTKEHYLTRDPIIRRTAADLESIRDYD